ncbi:lantibiotic dehydratase [Kitasatospora sp. NPDC058170]|uniref:lantibiotic dehydratase n=1 Tax=Kitasatospora sp. NPDC058170 TaxID=3346364 RepID=UPI0036D9E8B5
MTPTHRTGHHPVAPPRTWTPADTPVLRVNPTAGLRLGGDRLHTAVRALFAAQRQCDALADEACERLYRLAGSATGRERHRLLRLKRDVFNHRDPLPADLDDTWHTPLPPAVADWLAAHERGRLARTALETGHAALLAEERERFAHALGSEPFQLSLALNSPQVLDAVQRYRAAGGRPTARLRKSERGLVQHLARAVLRVSPLSRFTAVGFATWAPTGPRLDQTGFDRRRAHHRLTPDRALLSGLVNGILAAPRAGELPDTLQRNPMLRREGDRIRFQHAADGRRRTLAAELNEQLTALLRLTALGALPADRLADELARRFGVPPADAHRLVAAAADTQILVAGPVLDEQAADPLPAAEKLLADEHPEAAGLVAAIRADLDLMARDSVGGRRAALTRIRTAETALNALSTCPARFQVNEDCLLEPATVSPEGYRRALADLGRVAAFQSLFDRHHEIRALLTRAFTDRFGPGAQVDLVDHAEDLVDLVRTREPALTPDRAARWGPADGSLPELLRHRAAATAELAAALREAGDDAEAHVDPALLAEAADRLPERFRLPAASYGLLVQPLNGRLVLNACYTGHGQLATRFLGAQTALGGDAAERIARLIARRHAADGVRLREDHGLHRANINHRVRLLDEEVTPGQWLGVRLAHDPDTDRLGLLDADGRPLRVMALGMKWIELQPAPLTVAVWLHDTGRVAFDPIGDLHARRTRPATATTVRYPRLVAGDVVLQRRRWYPGEDLPHGTEPEDEAAHLIALTRWRAAHDVPEEIVLKTPLAMPAGAEADGESAADRLTRYLRARGREKPQYLDLGSALMARVLPKFLERRGAGYFEEALPGVRNGVHAAEWLLEYDQEPETAG